MWKSGVGDTNSSDQRRGFWYHRAEIGRCSTSYPSCWHRDRETRRTQPPLAVCAQRRALPGRPTGLHGPENTHNGSISRQRHPCPAAWVFVLEGPIPPCARPRSSISHFRISSNNLVVAVSIDVVVRDFWHPSFSSLARFLPLPFLSRQSTFNCRRVPDTPEQPPSDVPTCRQCSGRAHPFGVAGSLLKHHVRRPPPSAATAVPRHRARLPFVAARCAHPFIWTASHIPKGTSGTCHG